MDYKHSYKKGWPEEKMWERFVSAIQKRDAHEIEDCVNAQNTKAVDADIHLCKTPDTDLMIEHKVDSFVYGDENHLSELKFLHELAEMRDTPLLECDNNFCANGYRVPSWFFEGQTVPKYRAGVDYLTNDADYQHVQAGKGAHTEQLTDGATQIITGRDAAAYVHKDHPLTTWFTVADKLLANGVHFRVENGMVRNSELLRFASCGPVHVYATLGEGLKRLSPLSFREKWEQLVPRPEEVSLDLMGKYLPQTYAEGSPYHPSRNAMHFIAAAVLAEIILLIFDRYHVLPSGRTVEDEVNLYRDNIGYWRCWAGVHYPSDNTLYIPRAKALANRIVSQRYGN